MLKFGFEADYSVIDLGIGSNERWKVVFANGYGASVVKGPTTYGGSAGLYELAVLDSEGRLDYSTPITDDVIGHLDEDEVSEVLKKIQAL